MVQTSMYDQLLALGFALLGFFLTYGNAAMKPWCSLVDVALVGRNFSSIDAKTHKLCHVACLNSPKCKSTNYWLGSNLCELNSASHFYVCGHHLVRKQGSLYTFTDQMGCHLNLASAGTPTCQHNGPAGQSGCDQDCQWQLVFKGAAGKGVKLYQMWTTTDWNASMEVGESCRDNVVHEAWRNGEMNIKRIKFSLYNDSGSKAELIFNGKGSDLKSWFSKDRLISSPWQDLDSTTTTNYFSADGDLNEDRHFYINANYAGCPDDYGWLAVVDSDMLEDCWWEREAVGYPYPIILYSKTSNKVKWQDLVAGVDTVGRAEYLTIHISCE